MENKLLKFSPMYFNPKEEDIIYLNLNASNACNYKCKKCMMGEIKPDKNALNIRELIGIVDQAKDELNIKSMYLSGRGETFLVGKGNIKTKLENYKQLIKHANKRNVGVMQFTNGYYLSPEITDFLINQDISIVFSIDTLNEQKYNELCSTSNDSFQRVMDNLNYARKKFPIENNIYRLGINTAINHVNLNEINQIKNFCKENIIFFSNYPLIEGNFKKNLETMCISKEEYKLFKQKVEETSEYHNLAGICQNGVCGFYYNGLTIDTNGNVLLSPYNDSKIGELFGNIKEYNNMNQAVKKVRKSRDKFLIQFPDAKECPLRHPNYNEFPNLVKEEKMTNSKDYSLQIPKTFYTPSLSLNHGK